MPIPLGVLAVAGAGAAALSGDIGLFANGQRQAGDANTNIIDYITIASLSNAVDFGDTTSTNAFQNAAAASSTRAIFKLGGTSLEYVTIANTGNAVSFGDLTQSRNRLSGASNSTRAVFAGGFIGGDPNTVNTIDYVEIATTGNATDFGDLTLISNSLSACASTTKAFFIGGNNGFGTLRTILNTITIATTGNATSHTTLDTGRQLHASASNNTRGIFAGGGVAAAPDTAVNTMRYFDLTTGSSTEVFGNLSGARRDLSACSSSTRAVFGGGWNASFAYQAGLDYVEIATTGNGSSFGSLTVARVGLSGTSNCHGGI
jgi:hypothetical protein